MSFLNTILYTNIFITSIIYTVNCEQVIHGRYTRDIKEYELSVPRKISSSGEHVSFKIKEYYRHDFKRRERSTDSIYYNVVYNGVGYNIELWPNHGVFSPNLVIEKYQGRNTPVANRRIKRMDTKQCHYIGRVIGDNTSRVALSVCDGLAGYFITEGDRYFIEPLAETEPNENGEHIHIIYKRELKSSYNKKTCHTGKKWEEDWEERFRREYRQGNLFIRENPEKQGALQSVHRYLETLVVADEKFLKFHKNTDHEKYIMTIMNMVSDYYHDATAGNQMDVVVVRIIYLDKPEKSMDLETSQNAEDTLANFCKWQETINPADLKNPQHHDIAVLLTRYDICSDNMTNCDLMGLAYVAAACTGNKPCAINEDSGLTLGVVVAHEMGHVMGCSHDNGVDSPCKPETTDGAYHVMSPFVHLHTTVWSVCSRSFITQFFENGFGECLNDEPTESLFHDLEMPPGAVYDADFQCDLLFPNLKAKACVTDEQAFCKRLFCRTKPDSCSSNGEPPAEGTKCGENKWCYNGVCTRIGRREKGVDGGWGNWGEWSECSRTCGGGIKFQQRDCDNPKPTNHGRYCLGQRKRVEICNPNPCGEDQPTFREQQCTEYNEKPVKGVKHTWKPFWKSDDVCSLYCINDKNSYMKLAPRAKDGTLCKLGSHDRCVFGVCRKVGCDMKLDSDVIEDVCGICGGDGSECEVIKNKYNAFTKPGYVKVVTIPKGARNILIEEEVPSPNTIAVGQNEKNMYLNGNFMEDNDGVYNIGGVNGIYEHPQEDKETLNIAGPLKVDINLYIVFYERKNPGVRYEYAIQNKKNKKPSHNAKESKKEYSWEFLEWSECSKRCNSGFKVSQPACVEKDRGKISSTFCKTEKPKEQVMSCNIQKCGTRWHTGPWGVCDGCLYRSGIKKRNVYCVREAEVSGKDDDIVGDELCSQEKPASKKLCCSKKPCTKINTSNKFRNKLEVLWSQINNIHKKDVEDASKTMKKYKYGQIKHSKIHSHFNKYIPTHKDASDVYSISKDSIDSKFTILDETLDPISIEALPHNQYQSYNSCEKGSTKLPKQLSVNKDYVPENEVKMIEAPIVKTSDDIKLSDQDIEKMGDKLYDQLDICHEHVFTGKDAVKYKQQLGKKVEKEEKETTENSMGENIEATEFSDVTETET